MAQQTLKIALITHDNSVSAWQYLMLERLVNNDVKNPALQITVHWVFLNRKKAPGPVNSIAKRLLGVFYRMDTFFYKKKASAQSGKIFSDLLPDVMHYELSDPETFARLQGQPVDLILDLSSGLPTHLVGALLKTSRLGLWRHFYSKSLLSNDSGVGIDEYISRAHEIVSGLECLTATEPEQAICLFYATTSTHPTSLVQGIEACLWKMADFVPNRLQRLSVTQKDTFYAYSREHYKQVFGKTSRLNRDDQCSIIRVLSIFLVFAKAFLRAIYEKITIKEQWVLLLRKTADNLPIVAGSEQFKCLMPPADRFWADPFLVFHKKKQYVFFEELIYKERSGYLACMELFADGSHAEPVKILKRPYHLSYPFVFEYAGKHYLLPETAENQCIELYVCERFPDRWAFKKTLMAGVEAYDATLLEYQGRWWLFASIRHHHQCSSNELLYIFHADSPLANDWIAHAGNPVVTEAAKARPAGRFFEKEGILYRPSQNCAGSYGRQVNINRVQALCPEHYHEETVQILTTDHIKGFSGTHTLDFNDQLTVTDAIFHRSRLRWLGEHG